MCIFCGRPIIYLKYNLQSSIDIARFKIPVRNFAPKTHLAVIGTYRKPRTSSTTFENPDFRNFRIRFPLPVLIKNPGNLMLVPEIPSNFG